MVNGEKRKSGIERLRVEIFLMYVESRQQATMPPS